LSPSAIHVGASVAQIEQACCIESDDRPVTLDGSLIGLWSIDLLSWRMSFFSDRRAPLVILGLLGTSWAACVGVADGTESTDEPTDPTGSAGSGGGGSVGSGGAKQGSGGSKPITMTSGAGGSVATGGAGGSGRAGGAGTGGGGTAMTPPADPDGIATVTGWFNNKDIIPDWATKNMGGQRDAIINAVVKTCEQFSPAAASNPGWKTEYCWAHLTGAMLKESSYTPTLNDTEASPGRDPYSVRALPSGKTAYDPTVGLLQIRFSSTVKDYNQYGPRAAMTAIGCNFPDLGHTTEDGNSDFWAATGAKANMAMMTNVACNVALGAWYYYVNATGQGTQNKTIYVYQYCTPGCGSSCPTAATLTVGLLAHLNGPSGAYRTDSGSLGYVNAIKSTFQQCMGGTLPSPDPFTVKLNPARTQYCQ
jgi:hypothetical protein